MTTRILVLSANPINTDRLKLDKEARNIQEGLQQAEHRNLFDIKTAWAVRPKDVRRAIINYKPHIIHFSGHGYKDGSLAFEADQASVQMVYPDALAGLLKIFSKDIQCVLLNACFSEKQADAISQHIEHVIGMSKSIGDDAAIEFAVGFYDAIGAGYPIKVAYELGCNAIQLAGIKENMTPIYKVKHHSKPSIVDKLHQPNTEAIDSQETDDLSTTEYEFILTGSFKDTDEQTVSEILKFLRDKSGDSTLTIKKVEEGSIRVVLSGSKEGFKQLSLLKERGELDKVAGLSVQKFQQVEKAKSMIQKAKSRVKSISATASATGIATAHPTFLASGGVAAAMPQTVASLRETPRRIPLQKVYEDLANIDQMDLVESARCREAAQQILANPKISLNWRDAIAERLHEANHILALKTVTDDDSLCTGQKPNS